MCVCPLQVDSVGMEEQERERRRQVVEKFQKAPFEEIAAHCGARVIKYIIKTACSLEWDSQPATTTCPSDRPLSSNLWGTLYVICALCG